VMSQAIREGLPMNKFEAKRPVHFETGPFLAGFILVGAGALLAFLGLVIGSLHSVHQGVRWARSMDQSPADVAKTKWSQVKAVSSAGANAWKDAATETSLNQG
jgi:hypothetical protein